LLDIFSGLPLFIQHRKLVYSGSWLKFFGLCYVMLSYVIILL